MSEELDSAFRYRHRAEETRQIAEASSDEKIRSILLRIAGDYEKMAQTLERIAERENRGDKTGPGK